MCNRPSYSMFGRQVNAPKDVRRVKDYLPAPTVCRYCSGAVRLVSNALFYGGREYGWPLAYHCASCGARVGCHPGTDIPLGTIADTATMKARREAHDAFDPLWKDKGKGVRSKAYRALSKTLGIEAAHISWLDASQCREVVSLCKAGKVLL